MMTFVKSLKTEYVVWSPPIRTTRVACIFQNTFAGQKLDVIAKPCSRLGYAGRV